MLYHNVSCCIMCDHMISYDVILNNHCQPLCMNVMHFLSAHYQPLCMNVMHFLSAHPTNYCFISIFDTLSLWNGSNQNDLTVQLISDSDHVHLHTCLIIHVPFNLSKPFIWWQLLRHTEQANCQSHVFHNPESPVSQADHSPLLSNEETVGWMLNLSDLIKVI